MGASAAVHHQRLVVPSTRERARRSLWCDKDWPGEIAHRVVGAPISPPECNFGRQRSDEPTVTRSFTGDSSNPWVKTQVLEKPCPAWRG